MFKKNIKVFGKEVVIICDGNCKKAWGVDSRPKVQLSENEDDYAWFADKELGIAPNDTGTYEGGHGKPLNAKSGLDMNKWCVRQCERCSRFEEGEEIKVKSFEKRRYNIPR